MAKKKTSEKTPPDFEQSLGQLEEIVHDLEEGSLGLETSLARYEEGVKLLRRCHDLLTRAQRRIELLAEVDAEGNPIARPMEDESGTLEEKAARRSRRRTAASEPSEPGHLGDSGNPPDSGNDVDETSRLF